MRTRANAVERVRIVGGRSHDRLPVRLWSPLVLVLVFGLLLPLALLREALIMGSRVPMGHDTFQYLHLQYVFFNEAVLHGRPPQWLPFMTQGTVSNIWILVSQGIVASSVSFMTRFMGHVNYLYIFHLGFLFDEFALLVGCVLLARRYFTSLAAVLFVAASVTYTAITSTQPWYDFHLFYLLPLILYSLDRAIRDASAFYLFMSGLFFTATLLGNLPYLLPVTAFAIVVFWAAMYAFAPGRTYEAFRGLRRRFSWRHFTALMIPVCLMIGFGLYLRAGWTEISNLNIGRGPRGEITTIGEFFTYGGYVDLEKFSALVARFSNNLDNTLYAGLLILPFALVGLRVRLSPVAYAFGGTALVLALFGAGTMVSMAFYYLFPLGKYFRHIGLTATVAKVFLVFFAGFGFEAFWYALARSPSVPWRERTPRERWVLLGPAFTVAIIVLLLLVQNAGWYAVFRFPAWGPWTSNQLYFGPDQLSQPLRRHLLLSAAFLVILLIVLLLVARRSRWALVAAGFLLMAHVADVLSVKAELEFRRVPRVDQNVVNLFEPYRYQFVNKRSQNYYGNERFAALAPFILGDARLEDDGRRPHSVLGLYGAVYWSTESFIFLDAAASAFRTDHWLKSLEAFYSAWVPASSRVPRHLGFPIPQSSAYAKLSGLGHPKLQLFSTIHVLPRDRDVEEVLANTKFSGDMVLAASHDALSLGNGTLAVFESGSGLPRSADERLKATNVSVEEFRFDTLKVRVRADAPAVLYYADAWHPDWRASVNGTPSPVIRTNLGYKSVIVPAGASEVLFRFENSRVRILLTVVMLTGLLTLMAVLYLATTVSRTPQQMSSADMTNGGERRGKEALGDEPVPQRAVARRGPVMPVWLPQFLRRGAAAFAATFPFWLFARERFTDDVWTIARLIDPTSMALVSPLFTLLATASSFLLALLTIRVRDDWYFRGVLLIGLLGDVAGIFFLGWNSGSMRLPVALHMTGLVMVAVMTTQNRVRLVSLAGAALLAYGWMGETVNVCRVPGSVLAIEHDATTSIYTALVRSGNGFKHYPVPVFCYESGTELIPRLVVENYHGYNIVYLAQWFYGIRRTDGPFSLERFRTGGYQDPVEGSSTANVKRLIIEMGFGEAHLIEKNYRGFNIVEYGQRNYAIPQGQGRFDINRVRVNGYSRTFEGGTVADVKRLIDSARIEAARQGNPWMVQEDYRGFNVLEYKGKYYAIPRGEGTLEIQRLKQGDYSMSFEGESEAEVKLRVDAALRRGEIPGSRLTEEGYHGYNIIKYGRKYYAIPQGEGAFDVTRAQTGGYTHTFVGTSVSAVKKLIDQSLVPTRR